MAQVSREEYPFSISKSNSLDVGKSSFLRAISGLWEVGDGRVTWNIRRPIETADSVKDSSLERLTCSDVMFIPQKPYNFLGSLRDQILYPYLDEMNTDPSSIGHAMSLPNGNDSIALGHIPSNDKFYKILQSVKLGELASRIGKGDPALGLTGNLLYLREYITTAGL